MNGVDDEVFTLLRRQWNVTRALQIVADSPREVFDLPLRGGVATFLNFIHIDKDHAETVDVSQPILLVPIEDTFAPIDGWHRIHRAIKLGLETVPAVFLTEEEEQEVRL